ncbi:hypothetical protein CPB85DRAFT_1215632 [Mucidula mucida]|nr:hypothetical protein CPB85DRAFT_1215632 [Mucidula mucida]
MSSNNPHRKQVEDDLKSEIAQVMKDNPGLNAEAALTQAAQKLLKNNPFVPPSGCPVNTLPNELLAYIFYLGMKMQEETEEMGDDDDDEDIFDDFDMQDVDDDDESSGDAMDIDDKPEHGKGTSTPDEKEDSDSDSDDDSVFEPEPPFQVLVSHVCSRWRQVSVNEPSLWTVLKFNVGYSPDAIKNFIERSKGLPLDIVIDASASGEHYHDHDDGDEEVYEVTAAGTTLARHLSKDDTTVIFDTIIPLAQRWRLFDMQTSEYETMFYAMNRLKEVPSAPLLETLQLYQYDDQSEELEVGTFTPAEFREPVLLFNGNAPKLSALGLWGVHIDWDASLSFLSGLHDIELAYHFNDVRPSFATFAAMLQASPELKTLSLCGSGPAAPTKEWGSDPISVPSLTDLVLAQHDVEYIVTLFPLLHLPNVRHLALDFDGSDCTTFVETLAAPHNKEKRSLLEGLEHLKIGGLPSNMASQKTMLKQLANLKSLNLHCFGQDELNMFEALVASAKTAEVLLPNLEALTTRNLDSKQVRGYLEARKRAGKPIARLAMSCQDEVEDKDARWFESNLEDFQRFEPSDSEEELVELDDDEEDDL